MDLTAAAAACRTRSSLSTKLPSGDFSSQALEACSARPAGGCGEASEIAGETRLRIRTSSAASAKPVAISSLTPESVSTLLRARKSWTLPVAQILLDFLHRLQADGCIRARQSEASQRRLQDSTQMVVGDDLGEAHQQRRSRQVSE